MSGRYGKKGTEMVACLLMVELSLMRKDTDIQNISVPLINLWEMWLQACAVFIEAHLLYTNGGINDVRHMYLQKNTHPGH